MNKMKFAVGEKIVHPVHGSCTVTFVGNEYVGVVFDDKHALLKKESFTQQVKDACPVPLSWPESTFVQEPEGSKHFMGGHWIPFFDDASCILRQLSEILPKSGDIPGFGSSRRNPPHLFPAGWAKAVILSWPGAREGIIFVLRIDDNGNELMSLFPFFSEGGQYRLEIKRVIVRDNQVEALIEARWGEAVIAFYDTQFVLNRLWYEANREYEFILTGIAYKARPAEIVEIPFTPNPDQVAWERSIALKKGLAMPEYPKTISLKDTAIFVQMKNGDIDEYEFRGTIKYVSEVAREILGQKAWLADVTVMRLGEKYEAGLKILITEKVWEGNEPPDVGDEIEGLLWLQGYLWLDYRIYKDS